MTQQIDAELFDQQAFDTELSQSRQPPIALFKHTLKQATETLFERFRAGRSATELVYARSRIADAVLQRAWARFFNPEDKDIALIAVGGYGRGELHPHSDIDLQILLRKSDKPYKSSIIAFTTFLWDIGLVVGHSVRTLKECVREAKQDITVATNLQEARLLVGAAELFHEQRKLTGPKKVWPSDKFFAAKLAEQIERHHKFGDTAYNLEPNIKEGPGGLRDIQMIGWVAKRHFNADTLHDLVKHDFLTEEEYQTLHEGEAFLWQIRFGLHMVTGRREDRLLIEQQRTLAKQFGYQDDAKSLAVEKFMKKYYRTVMELNRLNELLLQLFQEELLLAGKTKAKQINKRFQSINGYLEAKSTNTFKLYPFALLEVFLLMAQHEELKGVRANTIRLIRANRNLIDSDFRNDIRCRSLFMEILRQPHGVTHELRRMNRYGILAAYLPVFGNIVGQMQHDLFHVYTVDEHTLTVIRNLRRFTVPAFKHEYPLCSEIIREIPKQELLLLAALFHDIAKGRGGDHSTLGAEDAREFCEKHNLSEYDTRLVTWLVEGHLMMSSTAQKKDISDPEIVHDFACKVGDQNRLNYIYLLTVADIRATGPDVWNSWKDSLLRNLYFATKRALRRGLDDPVLTSQRIADHKDSTLQLLAQKSNVAEADINQLWERFDDEYFLRYTPEELAWHTEKIHQHGVNNSAPLVLFRHSPQRGGSELFIYTRENPRTFVQITSVLEQMGLTIVDARILLSFDNYTLDTYIVLDKSGTELKDEFRETELIKRISHILTHPDKELPKPLQHMPRQTKAFTIQTDIQFWSDEKFARTAMQVITKDRPGLLSRIARALLQCNIQLLNAKIATFGERAEDIFYILDNNNAPVSSQEKQHEIRSAIRANLDL